MAKIYLSQLYDGTTNTFIMTLQQKLPQALLKYNPSFDFSKPNGVVISGKIEGGIYLRVRGLKQEVEKRIEVNLSVPRFSRKKIKLKLEGILRSMNSK